MTSRADTCLRASRPASSTALISHNSCVPGSPRRLRGGHGFAKQLMERRADRPGADRGVEPSAGDPRVLVPAGRRLGRLRIIRHQHSLWTMKLSGAFVLESRAGVWPAW